MTKETAIEKIYALFSTNAYTVEEFNRKLGLILESHSEHVNGHQATILENAITRIGEMGWYMNPDGTWEHPDETGNFKDTAALIKHYNLIELLKGGDDG